VPRDEDGNGSAFAKPGSAGDAAGDAEPPAAGEAPPSVSEE